MKFSGLRITATLGAPAEVDRPVHLDALLMEVAYRRLSHARDVSRSTPTGDLVHLPIPVGIVSALGCPVPLASAWIYSADAEPVAITTVKRKDAADLDELRSAWTPGSGPGRNTMVRVVGTVARSVSWLAWGHRREVRKALELISSLGDRRRGGNGAVIDWSVEPDDTLVPAACVLTQDGRAFRHLPASWCTHIDGGPVHGAWRSPYWHPERQGPIAPAGRLVELRPDVLAALGVS